MRSPWLREAAESLFAVFFPSDCIVCHQELIEAGTVPVCSRCWAELRLWMGPECGRCGLPIASERALEASGTLCASCRSDEPGFDAARVFGLYSGSLRALILEMKFRGRELLGRRLGRLLAARWPWVLENCDGRTPVLAPVPLHPSRQRERGFNQAERIAEGLRDGLRQTVASDHPQVEIRALLRIRRTPPQTGLSLAARRENVRGVFSVANPERVRGRAVVLVDDVMTTGETLSACAGVLRAAGAERVLALAVARATPQFPDGAAPARTVDGGARG